MNSQRKHGQKRMATNENCHLKTKIRETFEFDHSYARSKPSSSKKAQSSNAQTEFQTNMMQGPTSECFSCKKLLPLSFNQGSFSEGYSCNVTTFV